MAYYVYDSEARPIGAPRYQRLRSACSRARMHAEATLTYAFVVAVSIPGTPDGVVFDTRKGGVVTDG